jgi:DNA-binding NarL/FixJ family response regulator
MRSSTVRVVMPSMNREPSPAGDRGGGARPPARLLIADDHDLVREGLRAVLSGEDDLEVVGEAKDGREALRMCRSLSPDLVLMDVRMPKSDGLEATRAIKEEMPEVSVMMVTMHENPDYLLEAIRAGAAGYILKDAEGERLVGAVRRTLNEESPLDEELAMRLLQSLAREKERSSRPSPEAPVPALTAEELEVLRLLALGQTNRQISRSLLSSVSTVKAHVRSTIAKLGVSDRTQAAVRAIQLGLASSGMER